MSYEENERVEYAKGEYPETIICELCKKEFGYSREKRTTKHVCRTCLVNRHRWTLKARMVEYKGGCCQLCGYNRCLAALDFHHIAPDEKDFNFGGKHNVGWDKLLIELNKCICVCTNCHREIHAAKNASVWGHPPSPILTELERIGSEWKPPEKLPRFTRSLWKERHPKYHDPTANLTLQQLATAFNYSGPLQPLPLDDREPLLSECPDTSTD